MAAQIKTEGNDVTEVRNLIDQMMQESGEGFKVVRLRCRGVRFGSYRVVRTGLSLIKVLMTEVGLRMSLKSAQYGGGQVEVCIPLESVTEMKVHFSKRLSVIFMATKVEFATWARQALGMDEDPTVDGANYYCPVRGNDSQKLIVLLMNSCMDQDIAAIKGMYNMTRDICYNTANELLIKVSNNNPSCRLLEEPPSTQNDHAVISTATRRQQEDEGMAAEPTSLAINRKLLQTGLLNDASIVVKNGIEMKCHRNILAAHSSVFLTMFQTDVTGGGSSTLELPGMSEESGRALLEYLYLLETKVPDQNSLVCLELLEVGQEFNILCLRNKMQKIFMEKEVGWCRVDVALRLFILSRGADMPQLKAKAMKTLKLKFKSLEALPAYHELFTNNIEAVKELLKFFATVV